MGAKKVVTGRDGHLAPLECLSAEALCHLPMVSHIGSRITGETKAYVISWGFGFVFEP